jgi:hypothetical protein
MSEEIGAAAMCSRGIGTGSMPPQPLMKNDPGADRPSSSEGCRGSGAVAWWATVRRWMDPWSNRLHCRGQELARRPPGPADPPWSGAAPGLRVPNPQGTRPGHARAVLERRPTSDHWAGLCASHGVASPGRPSSWVFKPRRRHYCGHLQKRIPMVLNSVPQECGSSDVEG